MEGTVKIPVLGPVKKGTALVGGAAVLGVFAVLWYRKRKAGSSSSSSSSASGAQVDPTTGLPAGSAEDQAALAQLGTYQGAGGGTGSVPVGSQPPASGPPGPGTFTTNADWAQYAESYLTGTVGLAAADVAGALGSYIHGSPLTATQVSIVTQAIAFAGLPPVAGPNGNPPSYLTVPVPVPLPGPPPPPPPHKRPPPHGPPGPPDPHGPPIIQGGGGGGEPPPRPVWITANGREDIHQIAVAHHDTETQVLAWNPGLRHLAGTGRPVPAGTKVRVR